jgi:hypothetical protein
MQPGIRKAIRQAWKSGQPAFLMMVNRTGMINWVAPPPKLPHPAGVPLATPTILGVNMELIQNCIVKKGKISAGN